MSVESRLAEWAEKTGKPLEELKKELGAIVDVFKKNIPGKTEEWYTDAAKRRLFLQIKAELTSPAKPYDVIFLGYSGVIDVTAAEIAEKKNLFENPETREQAKAEGKVSETGVPLDTRLWMIPPREGFAGRKNPWFGKKLEPMKIRTLVGLGRPASGGQIKFVSVMEAGEERVKLLPPIRKAVRTRLNLRSEDEYRYVCNSSVRTKFEPIVIPEFEPNVFENVLKMLGTAPNNVSIAGLPDYHTAHEKDVRRIVVVEGDVSRINREPTAFGSYLIVLEDASKEDLEAEGLPVWIPGDLEEALDFGVGSRVIAIGRTGIGPGFNRETGQLDASIERMMLNASALIVIPEFRVPPEEEAVIEGAEEVK